LTEAGSLPELVSMVDTAAPMDEQLRCLAGAVYFEARGEPLAGQLAVAQVIINRSEDSRFPRSYCGVVAQPGQFSFMRGSRMPAVRESSPAWTRAVAIAQIAHQGMWESEAGNAVFFHARYVSPGWSRTKTRLAQIDTHIFYR
jgi:spore germination cell wall hydrolase CwlJ-like protein